jgi:hypothetical protein
MAAPSNRAPLAGTIVVAPGGTGMAGVTAFTFSAQGAQDPDGNALTFNWNFGDGSTAVGPTPNHIYATAGTFAVTVSVSDGQQSVSAASVNVAVGPSLTGAWADSFAGTSRTRFRSLNLSQDEGELTGNLQPNVFFGSQLVVFALTGELASPVHPTRVYFTTGDVAVPLNISTFNYTFDGETDATGTSLSGTLTELRRYPPDLLCGPGTPCAPVESRGTITFRRQ